MSGLGFILAPLIIVISVAIAVFYDGAIDPELVIKKTAVYGALGALLAFLFAGIEGVASSAVTERLGLPASTGAWLASGTVALAFGPLRTRVTKLAERMLG